MKPILLFTFLLCTTTSLSAQPGRSYVRSAVRKSVEKKMDSTYRKPGRKAVRDVTYKNDKRYKNPNNKVLATIVFTRQFLQERTCKARNQYRNDFWQKRRGLCYAR